MDRGEVWFRTVVIVIVSLVLTLPLLLAIIWLVDLIPFLNKRLFLDFSIGWLIRSTVPIIFWLRLMYWLDDRFGGGKRRGRQLQ
jgi:hypothetical protein